MLESKNQLIQFLIHSHLWIALAVGAFGMEYFLLAEMPFEFTYILVLCSATMLFYSLHRSMQIRSYADIDSQRIRELRSNRNLYIGTALLSSIVFLALLPTLGYEQGAIFMLLALPFLLYLIPVFKNKKRGRDLPYVKIFLIALGWTILCLVVPNVLYGHMTNTQLILLGMEHFVFIILLTIPFDIRDVLDDNAVGLKTLINLKSVQYSKRLSLVLCIFYLIYISVLFGMQTIPWQAFIAYIFAILCIIGGTQKALPTRSDLYYSFYLDGIPILRFLLFYLLIQLE